MSRMRMAIAILSALVALALAGIAAGAAAPLNTYTTSVTARQTGSGTAAKPVPFGMVQTLGTRPAVSGDANADPLTDITVTLPKVIVHATGFPVCRAATIASHHDDDSCPRGALVAVGNLTAALWSPSAPSVAGTSCDPVLDVWNAGARQLTYFVQVPAGHTCAGLQTGDVAPWTGTLRQSGHTLIDDDPLPPALSTNAGGLGLYLSIESETLTFARRTARLRGRTVAFLASVGCVAGRRPYTVRVTATDGAATSTATVSRSGGC